MQSLEVAPGVSIALPEGARELPPPAVDVSSVPGAELTVARAFSAGPATVHLVCARAPAWFWAQGLEGPILAGANALVQKTAGLVAMQPGELARHDNVFVQSFAGQGNGREVRGQHVLGRMDDAIWLCTVACSEPKEHTCVSILEGAPMQASFDAPPEGGAAAGLAALALSHPGETLASSAAGFCLAAAVILARRPRPRR
jgi:hypothetical protein